MKQIKFCLLIFFASTLFFTKLFSQTTTINYAGVVSSQTSCYFTGGVRNISGINHQKGYGDVTMIPTGLVLFSNYYNFTGTSYSLNYQFDPGYNYVITTECQSQNHTTLQVAVQTGLGAGDGTCPPSLYYGGVLTGTPYTGSAYPGTNLSTQPLLNFSLSGTTVYNYLIVTASGGDDTQSGTLSQSFISKIIITKTATACTLPAPTGLSVYIHSNDYAGIQWNAVPGAVSYTFDYKPTSSSTWITPFKKPIATSVLMSGLSNGTIYDMRVRANCTTNSGSYATGQFSTDCFLAGVTNLVASAIVSNSSTVTWTYPANPAGPTVPVSFNLEYKLISSGTWNTPIIVPCPANPDPAHNPINMNYTLTGLTNAATYDLRVRANCQAGSGNYVVTQFPSTSCATPTVSWTSPINTECSVGWSRMSLATGYDVQLDYAPLGAHNWQTLATNINPGGVGDPGYNFTGLTPQTTYAWRVLARCSNGFSSSYTAATNFTTLANCTATISNLATSGLTSNSVVASWTNSNVNTASQISYKTVAASSWTCFNYCLNQSSPTTITGLSPSTTYLIRVTAFCPASTGSYGLGTPAQVQITTPAGFAGTHPSQEFSSNNSRKNSDAKIDDSQSKNEFQVFPTPVKNDLTIRFDPSEPGIQTIELIDVSGNILLSKKLKAGDNQVKIDVSKFNNGLYILKVIKNNLTKTEKVIIQH